ncbi:GNAT family N-acetyltransferase [Candidatus Bathyarchaeota archaeon]|nr:GNAT family N-acetyltransferase [Candidatus Bathyarchaeota archaeon]
MSLIRKPKRKAKPVKKKKQEIEIRQMVLEDLSEVWHVGEKIFTPSYLPFTYRTWNVDELLSLFNGDPELCLVAEGVKSNKIVGFALGVILKRPLSPWKYGYFNWVGVKKIRQRSGVGRRLYKELERRFKQKGARIAIVDVENNNHAGVRFVNRLGFKQAESCLWFSKNIEE